MATTDRTYIKRLIAGVCRVIPGIVDPVGEVGRQNQETFTFEIGSNATIAEMGLKCTKAFRVISAEFTPAVSLAASGSAYITLLLQKRDGAGGAAVTVASTDTNTAGANVALTAWIAASLALSTTGANLLFAVGNVLTFKCTQTSSPTAPIGKVTVTVEYI